MHLSFKSLVVVALVALLGPVLAAPTEVTGHNLQSFEHGHVIEDKALSEKWYTTTFGPGLGLTQDPITQAWLYGNAQIVNWRGLNGAWNYNAFNPYYGAIPVGANIPVFPNNYFSYFNSPYTTYNGFNLYNGYPGFTGYNNWLTGRMGFFPGRIANFGGSRLFGGRYW